MINKINVEVGFIKTTNGDTTQLFFDDGMVSEIVNVDGRGYSIGNYAIEFGVD